MNSFFRPFSAISAYIALSFILTLLLLSAFIFQSGSPDGVSAGIYLASIPSYYYFLIFFSVFALTPLYFLPYFNFLLVIPKVVLDCLLFADIFVFYIYRFHIDLLFIDMVIHDFNGFGFSPFILVLAACSILAIFFINFFIYAAVRKGRQVKTGRIVLAALALLICGQMIHISANYSKLAAITRYTPAFPYYYPATSHSNMEKLNASYPAIFPAPAAADDKLAGIMEGHNGDGLFNYPLKPMQCNAGLETKPNILFYVMESWRSDMLSGEITPNIARFAQRSYQFDNHFSGGSVTASGLFSLMYGLHPTYMKNAQAAPYKYQTQFVKSLSKLGYRIEAYSSSGLDRFDMKAMYFGKAGADHYENDTVTKTQLADRQLASSVIKNLQQDSSGQPWFKFVFLTSSHFNYKYPKEYRKFKPIPKNSEAFLFNRHTDSEPFLNDYKNSLYYLDALFEEIRDALEKTGQDKNTVVVVTSDHGEGFNDNGEGYWGHGGNFTRYQTGVPLLLHLPGQHEQTVVKTRSGHVDITPTLLTRVLGCDNDIGDFSSGRDLLALPDERGILLQTYVDKAYLVEDNIYQTGHFLDSYSVDDINIKNTEFDYNAIKLLRQEESRFLVDFSL
jgi:membrane-anchored protein YejM (alkaline phosphatase superfamily)